MNSTLFLIDKSDSEMRFFTGFMTNEDRVHFNKKLQGLLTQKMISALQNNSHALPQWAAIIWNNINNELYENQKIENGPQKHIDEARRIIQTALTIHKDREKIKAHTMDELEQKPDIEDEQVDVIAERNK